MLTLIQVPESDYCALYGFMYDTWMEAFSHIISAGQIELLLHKYFDAANVQSFLEKGYQYRYIHDGEKAGLLVYADKGGEIYIDKLYILSRCRGKGYASFALNELIKLGKDLTLNVNRYNARAIAVYKHLGFEVEKEIDLPLGNGMVNQDYFMRRAGGSAPRHIHII